MNDFTKNANEADDAFKEMCEMIEAAGGSIVELGTLPDYPAPDGTGITDSYMLTTFTLPEDHWVYTTDASKPPMPLRLGKEDPRHDEMVKAIWAAAKYAVCSATMNGKEPDFDPDALCQNMVVGLIGYFTEDGLSELTENPSPIPPKMPPYSE